MSTITVVLEPDAKGCIHLALPDEMRVGKVLVTATPATMPCLSRPIDALRRIAARGGIQSIPDPLEWQRIIREDRPLTGRDE